MRHPLVIAPSILAAEHFMAMLKHSV